MANIYTNLKKKNTDDVVYPNISPAQNIPNGSITGGKLANDTITSEKLNFHLYNLHIKISCETDGDGDICHMSLNMIHTSDTITYAELKTYLSSKGYIDTNTSYPCAGRIEFQNFETSIIGVSSAYGGLFVSILDYPENQSIAEKEISDVSVTLTIDATQLF